MYLEKSIVAISLVFFERVSHFFPFRTLLLYQGPKTVTVIVFFEVADFVNDDVILELFRQKYDFVIEIEIASLGATPPSSLLVSDADGAK